MMASASATNRWLTRVEAANRLGISVPSVRKYAKVGYLEENTASRPIAISPKSIDELAALIEAEGGVKNWYIKRRQESALKAVRKSPTAVLESTSEEVCTRCYILLKYAPPSRNRRNWCGFCCQEAGEGAK
jgi:hypothetical protein